MIKLVLPVRPSLDMKIVMWLFRLINFGFAFNLNNWFSQQNQFNNCLPHDISTLKHCASVAYDAWVCLCVCVWNFFTFAKSSLMKPKKIMNESRLNITKFNVSVPNYSQALQQNVSINHNEKHISHWILYSRRGRFIKECFFLFFKLIKSSLFCASYAVI